MDLLQSLITPYEATKAAIPPRASQQSPGMTSIAINEPTASLTQRSLPSSLPNVFSIEEFERQHHEQALLDAQLQPSRSELSGRPTTTAGNGTTTARNPASQLAPAVAVPLGKPRTTEHIKHFHELCQQRGIAPAFEFENVDQQRFGVRLSFGDKVLEEKGPFNSKKEAKEAVAERGLEVVREMVREGALSTDEGGSRGGGEERAENWIGLLLEYSNATTTPAPLYQDYSVGKQFACEVTLKERSSKPFGGQDKLFMSKKAAKANAAREAVIWLREQGHMGEHGPPKKKAKINGAAIALRMSDGSAEGDGNAKDKSFAQQVNELCPVLGLSHPEYRFRPDERAPGFLSGAAYFPLDPLVSGPIGEVRNVFGKKAAKEQCAKVVLESLKRLQADRMALAEKALAIRDEAARRAVE